MIGVKSTARLFGSNSKVWLRGFMVAAVVLMALAVIGAAAPGGNALSMAVGLIGVWAFGWHMAWQLRRLDVDDPSSCLAIFRLNRDAGLIPELFLAAASFL